MRALLTILCLICFASTALAVVPPKRTITYPEGTFRKQRNGTIVHYDKKGKKVGVYKLQNGRYVQIK